jgi:uncharacterized membrane protein YqiK
MGRHRKNVATPRAALDNLIAEVRDSRQMAASENSWGAVSSMHRLELDCVKAAWEREEAEAEAKRQRAEADAAKADPATLVATLREALFALPLPLRERLLADMSTAGIH